MRCPRFLEARAAILFIAFSMMDVTSLAARIEEIDG
jgi:hypothetical protein